MFKLYKENEVKFLCDQMCAELGRWLRIAGYDTEIAQAAMPDAEILKIAEKEKRFLLTRDRRFKELDPEGKTIIYLRSEALDNWAKQLKDETEVNWLFSPFSRCLQCNAMLKEIPPPLERDETIPKDVSQFWICTNCNHLFWRGSHTDNMERQLEKWEGKNYL